MQRQDLVIFFVFLALSSVLYRPLHLFNASCVLKTLVKKGLIKKIWRKSCSFLLWTRLPKKGKNLSLNSHSCH